MPRHFTTRWLALTTFAMIVACPPCLIGQVDTEAMANTELMSVVSWSASLSGKREIPTVLTNATGKAGFTFDFANRKITMNLVTRNLQGVQKIELRMRRSAHDASGPAIIKVYDEKDGPFDGSLTKTFPSERFKELATAILNDRAIVTVCTESHPDGEITGRVEMKKSYR